MQPNMQTDDTISVDRTADTNPHSRRPSKNVGADSIKVAPRRKHRHTMLMPICFLLGFLFVITVIAAIPIPDSIRYASLKGDMTRVREVHDRIVANPKPIDIAFIGTSHTWNGIQDAQLDARLSRSGKNISVANLASSWPGRDLHLFILKQLLEHKKPRLIVIEIGDHEYPFGHGVLPYVGNAKDLCRHFYLDPQCPQHFGLYLKRQIVNGLALLKATDRHEIPPANMPFGWMPLDGIWNAPVPRSTEKNLKTRVKEFGYHATQWYGMANVRDMARLARQNGVDVLFLYLPEYEHAKRDPVIPIESYTLLAPILRMPKEISDHPEFWHDQAHLNREGSSILAKSLAHQLRVMWHRPS